MIKQHVRRIQLLLSAFALVVGTLMLWTAPSANAQAGLELLSCTGTQTAHYAPALGPALRDTTVHVDERVGTDGRGICIGPFTGGHAEAMFQEQVSCLIPPPAGTVTPPYDMTFHWNNGEQSTITFTVNLVTRVAGQTIVTSTGTVTDGFGQGALVQREKILVDLNILECLTSSVGQRSGPMTLIIGGI